MMDSLARRLMARSGWVALGVALVAGSAGAQAATKPAKAAATPAAVKGQVTGFAKNLLQVDRKVTIKLQPGKTKVVTSRGPVAADKWNTAIAVGDQVVVDADAQRVARSVKVLPPPRLKDGEYITGVTTTYNYIASPTAEPKPVPLLWLYPVSGKKVRYLVQIDETTQLSGGGFEEGAAGPEALRAMVQQGMRVKVTMSTKAPTVEKYGDVDNAYFINGVAKAIEILSTPEQE